MSFPDGPMQDARVVTEIAGEKCPDCGWRGGAHRPPTMIEDWLDACPRYGRDDPGGGKPAGSRVRTGADRVKPS